MVHNLDKDERGKNSSNHTEVQVFNASDKSDSFQNSNFLFTIGGHPANFIPSELVPLTKNSKITRKLEAPPTKDRFTKNKKQAKKLNHSKKLNLFVVKSRIFTNPGSIFILLLSSNLSFSHS